MSQPASLACSLQSQLAPALHDSAAALVAALGRGASSEEIAHEAVRYACIIEDRQGSKMLDSSLPLALSQAGGNSALFPFACGEG